MSKLTDMINAGDYFNINRPRQYGKSTILFLMEKELLENGAFLPVKISFEGIDAPTFESHRLFIETFLGKIKKELKRLNRQDLVSIIHENAGTTVNFFHLDELLEDLNRSEEKIVLMIDEVDNASNNQLFLDFLGLLRNKYLEKNEGKGHTFYPVILAGVHDVKTLKSKIRPGDEQKFNSPWNIAAPFEIDMEFNVKESTNMSKGYLIIFDSRKRKKDQWTTKTINTGDKEIFTICINPGNSEFL
ncbi:MAG: hypothetical protein GY757_25665 [bacterium]|nr:hypothetical protein [bacterium]